MTKKLHVQGFVVIKERKLNVASVKPDDVKENI